MMVAILTPVDGIIRWLPEVFHAFNLGARRIPWEKSYAKVSGHP